MKGQGKRNDLCSNPTEVKVDRGKAYTVSRLQREAPELFAQVVAGTKIDSVTLYDALRTFPKIKHQQVEHPAHGIFGDADRLRAVSAPMGRAAKPRKSAGSRRIDTRRATPREDQVGMRFVVAPTSTRTRRQRVVTDNGMPSSNPHVLPPIADFS